MDKTKVIKTIALFAAIMVCIIVHASVWNGVAEGRLDGAYVLFSLVNLAIEGWGIKLIYSKHIE